MKKPLNITRMLSIAALASFATDRSLEAANLIFSNLVDSETSSLMLNDSSGDPLPVGAIVQLVTFPDRTPSEISQLAALGPQSLLAASTPIGDPSSIGTGADSAPGQIEFRVITPLESPLSGIHLLILNQNTPETSDEVLLLRISDEAPADGLNELPGYLAVQLDLAKLVYGTADSTGFSTHSGPIPASFQSWIQTQLGVAKTAADYLPAADPDKDNQASALEYALGSQANSGHSIGAIQIHLEGNHGTLRFLERTDDPTLRYTPEGSQFLTAGSWRPLPTPVTPVLNPPEAAPDNYRWVECPVTTDFPTQFLRLSIEITGEN
ncbi:hypothetical protein [Haloferula sp.]|uniref:hypothetical protein n=1 Tax=Haloferula sp. TaxID=2497595 RepID=UPI003C75C92E